MLEWTSQVLRLHSTELLKLLQHAQQATSGPISTVPAGHGRTIMLAQTSLSVGGHAPGCEAML